MKTTQKCEKNLKNTFSEIQIKTKIEFNTSRDFLLAHFMEISVWLNGIHMHKQSLFVGKLI